MNSKNLILMVIIHLYMDTSLSLEQPLCSDLSNQFCLNVWTPPNNGNLKLNKNTLIQLGKSDKSELSMSSKMDLLALIKAEKRLPNDYRKRIRTQLKNLKQYLANEKDDDLWYLKISSINDELVKIREEVAIERFRQKFPQLAKISRRDRNFDQIWKLKEIQINLKSEIIRAKYEKSENWKRVVRVFEQVRKDMIVEINNLKLSEDFKKEIIERVSKIELRFPDEDPRKLNNANGCGSTFRNAFYMFSRNAFTVCAGWFNAVQDDAALTFMIAHEISHAFDPQSVAVNRFMSTEIGKVFSKMCGASQPVYTCEEWDKIRKNVFVKQPNFSLSPASFQKLTQCLKSEKELKPFQISEVTKINEENMRRDLHQFALTNEFTLLASPLEFKDGKYKDNDFFMRPDRWRVKGTDQECMDNVNVELMHQIMKCAQYNEKDLKTRAQKFEESIKDLEQIKNIAVERWISFCGKDCADLVVSKFSRVVHEEFADWMAKKILAVFLEREKSIEIRRQALGTAGVWLCDFPGPFWGASDLTEREKKWSFESHPDDKIRRLSMITPKIAQLLNCRLGSDWPQSNNTCEL